MTSAASNGGNLREVPAEEGLDSLRSPVSVGAPTEAGEPDTDHRASSEQSQVTTHELVEDQEEQNPVSPSRQSDQHSVSSGALPQSSQSRGRFDAILRNILELVLVITVTTLFAFTAWFAQATFSVSSMERIK